MADVVCGKCNNPITQSSILTALGKSWHPEHFLCKVCNQPITEGSFNQKDGEPVCSGCYIANFTDVCFACNQHILSKVIKAMGKTWHEEHFVCGGTCKKPLIGASFYERDGQPFCKDCFEAQHAARCAGCSKAILEKAVVALDKKWHKECFKCQQCSKPISGNTFAVLDNQPMCTECAKV